MDHISSSESININQNYHCINNNIPSCRICFDEETDDNKLISPCKCTGNSKYIHEKCLHTWRFSNEIGSDARNRCMECKYRYKVTRIVKPFPILFKLCNNFYKHFFCYSFVLLFVINLIGESLCYSNKDLHETINNLMVYKLEGNYNNCLIIPNMLIIITVWYIYITINKRLLQSGNVNNLTVRGKIITTNIIALLFAYFLPTYTMLVYLISINYIYFKYFKSAIDDYNLVNEIITEYMSDVINPCQINNNIDEECLDEIDDPVNHNTTLDIEEELDSEINIDGSCNLDVSTNYSNMDSDEDKVYLV